MHQSPKFACKLCRLNYPDATSLLRHFTAEHKTTKCQLCSREAAEKGSFCPTCRKAFSPAIENVESYEADILHLEARIKTSQRSKAKELENLRELFLKRQKDLFCQHGNPRDVECQKCEVRPAQKLIVRVNLDSDAPAGTLKKAKPVIRIAL